MITFLAQLELKMDSISSAFVVKPEKIKEEIHKLYRLTFHSGIIPLGF